jgi:hypothetical protein
VPLQRLGDEGAIRVEQGSAHERVRADEPVGLDGAHHRLVVDAQLGGDGAHLPVLGEEQPSDPRAQLGRDHGHTSPRRPGSEAPLVLGKAGAGERVVPDVAALDAAASAAEPLHARGSVRRIMGGDLGAGRSQRHDGAGRWRGAHHRGGGPPLATVMRHLLSPLAIAALPLSVAEPTLATGLVPPPRREQARPARSRSAG